MVIFQPIGYSDGPTCRIVTACIFLKNLIFILMLKKSSCVFRRRAGVRERYLCARLHPPRHGDDVPGHCARRAGHPGRVPRLPAPLRPRRPQHRDCDHGRGHIARSKSLGQPAGATKERRRGGAYGCFQLGLGDSRDFYFLLSFQRISERI